MNLFKKTMFFLILLFLTIIALPLKGETNSLDIYYFNNQETLEDLNVSLYNLDEDFLILLEKEEFLLNETLWFHFYLEDYSFSNEEEYLFVIDGINITEPLKYTFLPSFSPFYLNAYGFSNDLEEITNKVTYATFIDRKQIKFFTKFPVKITEINILKNDTFISKDDYTFNATASQYFINLNDDLDFNLEYFVELTTLDGLISSLNLVNYNEIYTTGFFETLFNYNGDDLGAKYTSNLTTFKVWAPTLNNLTLNLYSADDIKTSFSMQKSSDGVFSFKSYGNLLNYEYDYSFTRNKLLYENIVDPYVKYISKKNRGLIIDLNSFMPPGFNSWIPALNTTNRADYVIYESSIKRLTGFLQQSNLQNRYLALTDENLTYTNVKNQSFSVGLRHLKDLGVTHLTLNDLVLTEHSLSVINNEYSSNELPGNEISELKSMIKTLNDNGINVILELNTYNNVITSLESLMPGYYYETNQAKIIKNEDKAFFETNHYMTSKYLESQISYLITEFKLKGLKLNPLNSLRIDYLNGDIREKSQNESLLFYGEFINNSPKNNSHKLNSPSSLEQTRHVGFIDDSRFKFDETFLNSTSETGLKGYILSSWSQTYNTLSPDQAFKRLNYFTNLSADINRQIKTLQLLSYGITVIKGGEEFGFYGNMSINYAFKDANFDLFNLYKELICFKKAHPSLKILEHTKLKNEVIYKVKDNLVNYQIINRKDLYPHILIVHNLGERQNFILPEGLKGYLYYNREGELNWKVDFDNLDYYKKGSIFDNNAVIKLQKHQSLILHFGLNKDNIIEEPIQTPPPPKQTNIIVYLLISGALIIISGIVVTYFILKSTKEEKL